MRWLSLFFKKLSLKEVKELLNVTAKGKLYTRLRSVSGKDHAPLTPGEKRLFSVFKIVAIFPLQTHFRISKAGQMTPFCVLFIAPVIIQRRMLLMINYTLLLK